jgi:hypothetical protein
MTQPRIVSRDMTRLVMEPRETLKRNRNRY